MSQSSSSELELTPDLIDYAKAIAIREAEKRAPKYVKYDDVVQEVLLHLISKPPKYDPAKGASEKTLIHTIVQRTVLKYVARQCRHANQYKQVVETTPTTDEEVDGKLNPRSGTPSARERMVSLMDAETADDASPRGEAVERLPRELTSKGTTTDDVLEFIDSEESRLMCRLYIECKGNVSEVARRLGFAEGTIRRRLKRLAPKLIRAGFQPLKPEEFR